MAVAGTTRELSAYSTSTHGRALSELQTSKKLWRDRGKSTTATSPERTSVWTSLPVLEPQCVPVVYYLSRSGHLDHPHLMEVPLSSPDGLYLRDVIRRLNRLRGTGMAALYSWSSKRSYKNGFVWQDLAENDFIFPSHGNEYVLKGSELLHDVPPPLSSSSSLSRPLELQPFRSPKLKEAQCEESNFPVVRRRRNQSWSSIDLHEYKVFKTDLVDESTMLSAAKASTQVDNHRRRARRQVKEEQDVSCQEPEEKENESTELTQEEISPPPSDSSPMTVEAMMKAIKRLVLSTTNNNATEERPDCTAENIPSSRVKAPNVLMQLLTCGSFSLEDCGAAYVKDQGLSLIGGHYQPRLPHGAENNPNTSNGPAAASRKVSNLSGVKLENEEYFSGSLIETTSEKLELVPALKRSSSYNADRSRSRMQMGEKEIDDGLRAKCIPRKLRLPTSKKVERGQEQQGNVVSAQGQRRLSSEKKTQSQTSGSR